MMWTRAVGFSVVLLACAAGPARADLVFDFSFTNNSGNVSGTVTGEILGLVDNEANQSASEVLIDSYPAGLGNIGSTPIDVTSWFDQVANSFTVVSGQLTDVNFEATATNAPPSYPSFTLQDTYAELNDTTGYVFSTAPNYSQASVVPEPASLTLLGIGIPGVAGYGWRRRGGVPEDKARSK
jgi:PEP-CTERM motif